MSQTDVAGWSGTTGMKLLVALVVMTSAYDFFAVEGVERFLKAGVSIAGILYFLFKTRQDEFFIVFLSLLLASFVSRHFL